MKIVLYTLAGLLAVLVLVFALQYVASERVEVVELHTRDGNGDRVTTRLWVVDDAGFAYLRSTDTSAGWAARALNGATVEVTREGVTRPYIAVPRPDKRDRINALMQSKYTWGDSVIAVMVGGRDNSTPLELQPQN